MHAATAAVRPEYAMPLAFEAVRANVAGGPGFTVSALVWWWECSRTYWCQKALYMEARGGGVPLMSSPGRGSDCSPAHSRALSSETPSTI
jgi:hypothetical protein